MSVISDAIYKCPKCGIKNVPNLDDKGPHTGLYCCVCTAFIKWATQREVDAVMKALIEHNDDHCKQCNFVTITGAGTVVSCGHPRYNGECPLPKEKPASCDCDECTCIEGKGCSQSAPTTGNFSPKVLDPPEKKQAQWDEYFMAMCDVVAKNCKCFSRQIGAVIVRDRAVLSTGYNGPPRGVPQCYEKLNREQGLEPNEEPCCPRQKLGAPTGTRLDLCYAQHAERNAITQAARSGTAIAGATLYLNDIIPCKDCLGAIINAGITEVVCTELRYYDADGQGRWLIEHGGLIVREALKC